MNDLTAAIDQFKVHIGGLIAAVYVALRLRKKVAADNVDVATDEQRRKWVDAIVLERDDLRQENRDLRDQHARDAEALGRLNAEYTNCGNEIQRLKDKIQRLETALDRRQIKRESSLGRRDADDEFKSTGF